MIGDDIDGFEEPIGDYPPSNGGQAEIDSFYFKKHAPALSRVLSCIEEGDVKGLFLDEEVFASFVFYCLSTTIKKGTWRLGRNKKLVSQLFTPYDEGLAILILENNADGIRDLIANGRPDKKKKIKTKYTCKGYFKKGDDGTLKKNKKNKADGGQGWTKAGMRRYNELTNIVKESRAGGRRTALEQRIKDSYIVKRSNGGECSDEDEYDDDDDDDDEPVYVCTGIPI
jgi:hypothetical protein